MRRLLLVLFTLACSCAVVSADELPRRGLFGTAVRDDPAGGVSVQAVIAGGAGEAAGVRAGDRIVVFNGVDVTSTQQYIAMVRALRAGQRVEITVVRGEERVALAATLKDVVESDPAFDVLYRSVAVDGARRRVLVTRPKGAGRHPAVLWIGGIGCYSIDNPFEPNDAYRTIAHELTRNGFVTMRVEKSGVGDSEGAPCPQVDFATEVKGYAAGLAALKSYDFVDPESVFIIGHSIGGISGPLVASQQPVKGVAAIATTGIWWFEYEMINLRRQLMLGGASAEEIDATMRLKAACMHALYQLKQKPEEITAARPDCASHLQYPAHYTYMQGVADQNMTTLWSKLDASVLVLYGTSDFVTSPAEHEAIAETVNRARPGRARLVAVRDMDHFLNVRASQVESLRAAQSGNPLAGELHASLTRELLAWLKGLAGPARG